VLASPNKVMWHKGGAENGIYYAQGTNTGFFPLNVTITFIEDEFGLIFDTVSGIFYYNELGVDSLLSNNPYLGQTGAWNWNGSVLTLTDFDWITSAPEALIIVGGPITLSLAGVNSFISTSTKLPSEDSVGVDSRVNLTITGAGMLNASASGGSGMDNVNGISVTGSLSVTGGTVNGYAGTAYINSCGINATGAITVSGGFVNGTAGAATDSYGIGGTSLTITGGTVTASGRSSAFSDAIAVTPPTAYAYWLSADPNGVNAAAFMMPNAPYSKNDADKYVKIQTLIAHTLTVDGINVGLFFAGQSVTITAATTPPPGPAFDKWMGGDGGVFADAKSSTTTFIMPNNAATVTATYVPIYQLTVTNGRILPGTTVPGVGWFPAGAVITIAPSASMPGGWVFDHWENSSGGGEIVNPYAGFTTYIMPASTAVISAVPRPDSAVGTSWLLTVLGGTGGGDHPSYSTVPITANQPSSGQMFVGWRVVGTQQPGIYPGAIAAQSQETTTFTMPNHPATIEAVFEPIQFQLIVINGIETGANANLRGLHSVTDRVGIQADPPPPGQVFDRWVTNDNSQLGNLADRFSASTVFTMPADSVIIEATYRNSSQNVDPDPEPPPPPPKDPSDVSRWLNTKDHFSYIRGVGDNLFQPDRYMNRAEAAVVLQSSAQ